MGFGDFRVQGCSQDKGLFLPVSSAVPEIVCSCLRTWLDAISLKVDDRLRSRVVVCIAPVRAQRVVGTTFDVG